MSKSFFLLSDLHVDVFEGFNKIENLYYDLKNTWNDFKFDALILAGDFCELRHLKRLGPNLRNSLPNNIPIFYTPGNHEFWGEDFHYKNKNGEPIVFDTWRDISSEIGFTPLLNEEINFKGLRILGTPWWFRDSDFFFSQSSDYDNINNLRQYSETLAETCENFLHEQTKVNKADLIISHHFSHINSMALQFIGDKNNKYFLHPIPKDKPIKTTAWVHGHTHFGCDHISDDIRYLCNPFGYATERNNFSKKFIFEL